MAARMSRDRVAVLAGLAAPLVLAVILVPFRSGLPNTDAALALILVVVAVAASGHRLAGVLAAVSAAAWFDFFLTVPYERFTITRRADIETTVLVLAIGAAVTEIAVRGRRQHAAAARRAGYLDGINAAARAVATGESAAALTSQVAMQEPAMAITSRTRTAVDQPDDKSNGNTCQMRMAAASPIPVVTASPSDFSHGGSWARYTTLAAIPAAAEKLTSHSTWSASLVRNGIACHPGQPLTTTKNATPNAMATQ